MVGTGETGNGGIGETGTYRMRYGEERRGLSTEHPGAVELGSMAERGARTADPGLPPVAWVDRRTKGDNYRRHRHQDDDVVGGKNGLCGPGNVGGLTRARSVRRLEWLSREDPPASPHL